MNVSIDISMYPLVTDYAPAVLAFIQRLAQNPKLKIERNNMSTQIFGDYQSIMPEISNELLISLKDQPASVFVIKLSAACHSDL